MHLVVIVTGSDEKYALGLAALVRSAITHRPPHHPLQLHIVDAGIAPATRARLEASWIAPDTSIHWHRLDADLLARSGLAFHAARAARCVPLVLDRLLPESVERVLCLDADMLVLSNLAPLWETDLNGMTVAAVRDTMIHSLGDTYLPEDLRHVANHPNFNSGLMLIDVNRWRSDGVGPAARARAARHHQLLWSVDQQILNWLLVGQWQQLPLAWNRMTHTLAIPSHRETCIGEKEWRDAREAPRIVHFTAGIKPWLRGCRDDRASDFAAVMRMTDWAPWSPASRGAFNGFVDDLIREPHRRYQFVRRGLKISRLHGLPRWRWWQSAAATLFRYPWTALTFPVARVAARVSRRRVRRRAP